MRSVLRGERPRIAVAAPFRSQPDERGRQGGRAEDRRPRDALRRRHVLLHQRRRQREHVRDVVEAVAGVVLREVVRRPQVDTQQVPDRVVVFRAVQPSRGDAAGIRRGHPVDPRELALEPRGDRLALVLVGLGLVGRRHLALAQLEHDLVPALAMIDQRRDRRHRLEVQIVLVLLVAVAGDAGLREERLDDGLEPARGRGGQDGGRFRGRGSRRRRLRGLLREAQRRRPHDQRGHQECTHASRII